MVNNYRYWRWKGNFNDAKERYSEILEICKNEEALIMGEDFSVVGANRLLEKRLSSFLCGDLHIKVKYSGLDLETEVSRTVKCDEDRKVLRQIMRVFDDNSPLEMYITRDKNKD